MIRTDCYHTGKKRDSICKGKRRARNSRLVRAVRRKGIRQPMGERVAQHTKAFGTHLRSTRNNQRQVRKVMSLMAVRRMDWKVAAARSGQVW